MALLAGLFRKKRKKKTERREPSRLWAWIVAHWVFSVVYIGNRISHAGHVIARDRGIAEGWLAFRKMLGAETPAAGIDAVKGEGD